MSTSKLEILQDELVTRILLALSGGRSYSTVQLLKELHVSYRDGLSAMKRAEQLELMRREKSKGDADKQTGRKSLINVLTPKGKEIAKLAKQLGS